jgi:hypothetical protein
MIGQRCLSISTYQEIGVQRCVVLRIVPKHGYGELHRNAKQTANTNLNYSANQATASEYSWKILTE